MEVSVTREDGSRMIVTTNDDMEMIGVYVESEVGENRTNLTALTVDEARGLQSAIEGAVYHLDRHNT